MPDQAVRPPASGGEAGYATLARLLTAFYAVDPPIDSRQVHQWHRRETKNKNGRPFPRPVREADNPRRGQSRYLFSVREALDWYGAGVPGKHGVGWKEPRPSCAAHLPGE